MADGRDGLTPRIPDDLSTTGPWTRLGPLEPAPPVTRACIAPSDHTHFGPPFRYAEQPLVGPSLPQSMLRGRATVDTELRRLRYAIGLLFDHRLVDRRGAPLRLSLLRVDSSADLARFRSIVSGAHA